MNYKLTVEEEAAIEHEVEMEREYLRMMGRSYTPIDLERILNKIRMRARNRIVDQRRKKEQQTAFVQGARISDRDFSIANLISQTYDILFPPEDDPVVTPEERLLQAIFGRENNVPMAEEVAFVDTVTNMAETLVRKYHASTSQQEGK